MKLKLALKAQVATKFYIETHRTKDRMWFVRQTLKTLKRNIEKRNFPDKTDIWYLAEPIKNVEVEHQ